jgi:hypothetical protein
MDFKEWIEKNPQPIAKKQDFQTYDKAKKMALELKPKFATLLKHSADGHKIVIDIKSEKSFNNKTKKRNKSPSKVFDILRAAILVDTKNQISKIVDNIKKHFIVKKVAHNDSPNEYEFGYYGTVHVDIVIGGMICEIQIATEKFWKHKCKAQPLYQKYRGSKPSKEDLSQIKKIYKKGNGD